jgi:hypothetical protein
MNHIILKFLKITNSMKNIKVRKSESEKRTHKINGKLIKNSSSLVFMKTYLMKF